MHDKVKSLLNKLIVSTQAYEDTPLYGASNMQIMAQSALLGGADAIRACWSEDIKKIRELGDFIIIGIHKIDVSDINSEIFITPTYQFAKEIIEAGADIIAIDARILPSRGKDELLNLLKTIKDNHPDIPIMADISNIEEAKFVSDTKLVDIIATTLVGLDEDLKEPNVEIIKEIKAYTDIPVNAEGNIWESDHLISVINAKADMVTIGSAISRPHLITNRFVKINEKMRKNDLLV